MSAEDNAIRISVLITCHNRRDKTLACIRSIFDQQIISKIHIDVYLLDDGSIDETSDFVIKCFPEIRVLKGDGNHYWCGGMRVAWKAALQAETYNYFLWLNDDTYLNSDAISEMIKTANDYFGIVVGSCCDPTTGAWTYGGRATIKGKKSLTGNPVVPNERVQKCQLMNGNVVLVPKAVVDRIGILSDRFTHAIGDFDYGFRAIDAGIPLIVAPHYQSTCSTNPIPAWCDPKTSFCSRLALFNSPKGIHFSEFMVFCYRHFGLKCILIGAKVIIRLFMPRLWLKADGRSA